MYVFYVLNQYIVNTLVQYCDNITILIDFTDKYFVVLPIATHN